MNKQLLRFDSGLTTLLDTNFNENLFSPLYNGLGLSYSFEMNRKYETRTS